MITYIVADFYVMCYYNLLLYYFICSSSPGQFGFTCSRRDKPQHAGADLAHVRGGSAADLHADAERLVPPLHKLSRVYRSAEEPGGAPSP